VEEAVEEDKPQEDKQPVAQDPNCWERNLPTLREIAETLIDSWPI
jgi:hypothetical protein